MRHTNQGEDASDYRYLLRPAVVERIEALYRGEELPDYELERHCKPIPNPKRIEGGKN